MRKPAIAYAKNKGTNELRSYCAADQRLCFDYMNSTVPIPPKSKIAHHPVWLHSLVYV